MNCKDYLDGLRVLGMSKAAIRARDHVRRGLKVKYETSRRTRSKIGGHPVVPELFIWPEFKNEPLAFVAQIDLSEVQNVWPESPLPKAGLLSFFYDKPQRAWGDEIEDRGSAVVVYSGPDELTRAEIRKGAKAEEGKRQLAFKPIDFLPYFPAEVVQVMNGDAVNEVPDHLESELEELIEDCLWTSDLHRVLGHSSCSDQFEKLDECALIDHGISASALWDEEEFKRVAKEIEPALESACEWMLFFQIDSDREIGLQWGDMGSLCFWIKEEDLKNRCFERCWHTINV